MVRSNSVQIRALNVSNFRSLGDDVRVEFPRKGGRLIALAGINGAGKSNVLDAFGFVGAVMRPSRRKRARASGRRATSGRSTFSATRLSRSACVASYTAPMPPLPRSRTTV